MPKSSFYAVKVGKVPGIYLSWDECKSQVHGYPRAQFKAFKTQLEAQMYMGEVSLNEEKDKSPKKECDSNASTTPHFHHETNAIHAYTDGSCRRNGMKGAYGGIGVYFGEGDPRNVSEKLEGAIQTNNRAELSAVIKALQVLRTEKNQGTRIVIHTDSCYVQMGMEKWMSNWKKKKWLGMNGKPIQNQDLWERLDALNAHNVSFEWVKGHSVSFGNQMADKLACLGSI